MGHARRGRALYARRYGILTLVPAAARSSSGSEQFTGMGLADVALPLKLEVAEASGTTRTLDVVVEYSLDRGETWAQKAAFTQRVGTGSETITSPRPHRDMERIRWTISGTGSPLFTFSVTCDLDKRVY